MMPDKPLVAAPRAKSATIIDGRTSDMDADRAGATALSVIDLFTIGLGPSSSHTVGPMRAAFAFAEHLVERSMPPASVTCDLYGSLAHTGRGHATDRAIVLGLMGWLPDRIDPDRIDEYLATVAADGMLILGRRHRIRFDADTSLNWHKGVFLPGHANAMTLRASFVDGTAVEQTYYSVGGGAIEREGQSSLTEGVRVRHPFASAADLLEIGERHGLSIADIVRRNEIAWRPSKETDAFLGSVERAMQACIDRGLERAGVLPGGLKVPRRAHKLLIALRNRGPAPDPSLIFEWVSLWALAVNEENAAGGRVVTAPTNGAAGILPAVIRYYQTFVPSATRNGLFDLLYTAAALGFLYKQRASISAAEMGCQGEVGVACSMAAGGLAAALGGTNGQIENAAEIGMEHNLGLTCDPVGGLVQIPCIERNTMGAIKAINAAYLALRGDGIHVVSLDTVIETMRQTGVDMQSRYKETSLGGLAVNVVEC